MEMNNLLQTIIYQERTMQKDELALSLLKLIARKD